MSTTQPTGLILIAHAEEIGITLSDMNAALPDAYRTLPSRTVELDTSEITRRAIASEDWTEAERSINACYREQIKPLQDQYPDYRIIYFGSAAVPLTIYLGYLLQTWQQIEIIPHHHIQRTWAWAKQTRAPRLIPADVPNHIDRTPGEAIIRVSTSHRVDAQVARQAVTAEPVLVDIDIALDKPDEDAFTAMSRMLEVATELRRTLDTIGDRFPGIQRVHLFAAVQPGMALLVGAQISKTQHPTVQTYQYARNAETPPLHRPAVLVNGPSRPEPRPLSPEDRKRAARDRERLASDLQRMQELATQEHGRKPASWIDSLLLQDSDAARAAFVGPWRDLPLLGKTPLSRTSVDHDTHDIADSFRLSPEDAWQIDDQWLARLARRLPDDDRRARGLRLLVLHELCHRGPQGLTRTSSQAIGRFPKVLEAMDYDADVWAMLYERELARLQAPNQVADQRTFFMELIGVATETMWAFDDDGVPLHDIQVRRLNRYLIWYWQYLLLEASEEDDVLPWLARRPLVELAGPPLVGRDERVYFALEGHGLRTPELAIYHRGRLHRHGERLDFSIRGLLDAVTARRPSDILDVLRAAVERIAR